MAEIGTEPVFGIPVAVILETQPQSLMNENPNTIDIVPIFQ